MDRLEIIVDVENPKGSKLRICFKGETDFDLMSLEKTFMEKGLYDTDNPPDAHTACNRAGRF